MSLPISSMTASSCVYLLELKPEPAIMRELGDWDMGDMGDMGAGDCEGRD